MPIGAVPFGCEANRCAVNRTLFAIIFGALSLLIIADVSAGYYHMGVAPSLGMLTRLDNSRRAFTTVTPQGRAAGIHAGDVLDFRNMDPVTRYRFASRSGEAGAMYLLPLERNGRIIQARITLMPRVTTWLDILDVVMRVLLAAAGILLIARGVERDSFWAGLFVCSLAVASGFGYRFWGGADVNLALRIVVLVVYSFGMWAARLLFPFALLPKTVPPWLRWSIVSSGCVALLAMLAMTITDFAFYFGGLRATLGNFYFVAEWAVDIIAVVALGVAAVYAEARKARAIRWIFAAMLVSEIGPWINFVYSLNGQPLPLDGLLNVTFIALAIVLPYAVLSQRLLAVNFVVSKALVYTLVLTVIVGVFILLEKTIENAALGRFQSEVFELIVPLGLGLSVKWIEGWAERIVERVLYRNKLRAEQELSALVEDFPHARDVQGLSLRVAREICRQMDAPLTCVYRESGSTYSPIATAGNAESLPVDADDPVFMRLRSKHAVLQTDDFATALPRHSAVFPLVVFGAVTGAVVVQNREFGEAYDPDELETLKRVAHELAIALLWVERARVPDTAVPAF